MDRLVIENARSGGQERSMLDIIQIVAREAKEECAGECCPLAASIDNCVQEVVTTLWPSRIKAFVPLLALRRVRECIAEGRCPSPPVGT